MRKIMIGFFILATSAAVFIGVSTGFFNKFYSPNRKKNDIAVAFKYSNPVNITIIGDSVAKGTGDEKGSGFSTYLPEYLKCITQNDISVYNAGINGLKSAGLVEQLKSGKLDSQIENSDMVVLSIGGNDLLTLRSVKDSEKLTALKNVQADYLDNLRDILNIIREKNLDAFIVFTGLYNPEGSSSSVLYDMVINTWNSSTVKLIGEGEKTVFVETQDILKSDTANFISPDRLHSSSAGYQAVSEKIVQLVMGTNQ